MRSRNEEAALVEIGGQLAALEQIVTLLALGYVEYDLVEALLATSESTPAVAGAERALIERRNEILPEFATKLAAILDQRL